MDDMNESMERVEEVLGSSLRRREFLTKAAAAGAVAWAAPVILSRPAYADLAGGSPKCQPKISLVCQSVSCFQGQKRFPGINVVTTDCGCPPLMTRPTTCIMISDVSGTCGNPATIIYKFGTDCSPPAGNNPPVEEIVPQGVWTCLEDAPPGPPSAGTFSTPFWFGSPRVNGSINEINSCTVTFRLSVWTGDCPDSTPGGSAFTCQTFNVTITWNKTAAVPCVRTVAANPASPDCAGVSTSPCTC